LGRLLVGWRLGFGARERAAGIPFRGRVVAIRGTSAAGKGRRPWGRRLRRPCLARHGVVTGKTPERKEIRSDRMGPHGSERRRKVRDSWAGCLCWAARIGGLAVCAIQRKA
jgi:hypothetical protein